ncbi:MAG: polysaccharide export protein, partial [Segetibacter sp.]|nr:polysaccharide export protein [Segetibacter sp.]
MSVNVKIFLFLVLIPFFGCFNTKKITYFNDLSKANGIDSIDNFQPVKVQRGDILQVYISSIDKDVTLLFNPNTSVTNNNNNPIMQGYLVDNAGQIELPVIGKIYVKGNTTEEINELIRSELNKTLKNFNVSTRLINFRVSVLGDVAKPGTFNIQNERVSILEAL